MNQATTLLALLALAAMITLACLPPVYAATWHFDNVLGTSMTIQIDGIDDHQGESAVAAVLEEIARLEAVLSTYQSDSEISRLNSARTSDATSPELYAVIQGCKRWQVVSDNHFSCKLGKIINAWREAEAVQSAPDRINLRRIARAVRRANITLEHTQAPYSTTLPEQVWLNVDGLAKGYVIDEVFTMLQGQVENARAIKLDIGGDGRYWTAENEQAWQVDISAGGGAEASGRIPILAGAVAASGHHDRGIEIGRQFYSHIIQPRDGWPKHNAPSSVVVAPNAMTADAIATTLANMSATQGIDWVNKLRGVEAIVSLPNGIKLASDNWAGQALGSKSPILQLAYEIPAFETGRYRRPYLAIWITDGKRTTVRNLLLLGESQRWARENSRWWRQVGRRDESVLTGLARPTKRPGQYQVSWDGLDDQGVPVADRQLTLHIEASREHGEHDYATFELDLANPNPISAESNGEIGALSLSWATEAVNTAKR
ncbi:MAG: DUF2271 domain-containing protein [Pseudomonadota bacterium]